MGGRGGLGGWWVGGTVYDGGLSKLHLSSLCVVGAASSNHNRGV